MQSSRSQQSPNAFSVNGDNRIWLAMLKLCCITLLLVPTQLLATALSSVQTETDLTFNQIQLTNQTASFNTGDRLLVLEDREQKWQITDILEGNTGTWFHHRHKTFSAGVVATTYWIRFSVENQSDLENWLIELGSPGLDYVDLYLTKGKQVTRKFSTGQQKPFIDRPILNRNFIFPLDFSEEKKIDVIFRINSDGTFKAPIKLWQPDAFANWEKHQFLFHGAFFGIILAMLIYNCFIYLVLKDSSYLHYVGYLAAFSCFFLYATGLDYQYFWPSKTGWSIIFGQLGVYFALAFACTFTRKLLNVSYSHPRLNRFLKGYALLLLAMSPSVIFLPPNITIKLTYAFTLVLIPIILYLAIHQVRAGFKPAKYYLAAWSILFIGIFVNMADLFSIIPSTPLTHYSIRIAVVIELMGLSLALASRIDTLKAEKQALQNQRESILEDTNQKLNQSNKLKDDFLSAISHELRTPMNGVIGGIDLLRGSAVNPEQAEYLKAIDNSSKRLLELISDILDFTEIQSGRNKRINKTFSFHHLSETIRDMAIDLRSDNVDFSMRIQNEIPNHLQGDPDLLCRALQQLLENAFKFTHQGKVSLEFLHNNEDYPDIQLFIYVRDTGIGIPEENQQTVFEAFQQVESGLQRKYEGMGLGLTLASALAHSMNGKLDLIKSTEEGSFFAIEVPLLVVDQPAKSRNTRKNNLSKYAPITTHFHHAELDEKHLTILIAEDNPTNQLVLKGIIKKLGHNVVIANNGREALEKVKAEKPDLVFMDCQMPEMDGLSATEAIRNLGREYKELPIIAVTANVMGEDKQKCLAVGMDDYLKKPVKTQAINASIAKWGIG